VSESLCSADVALRGDNAGYVLARVNERLDRLPGAVALSDGHGATVSLGELARLAAAMRGHPTLAGAERVTIVGRQSLRLASVIAAAHLAGLEFAVVDAGETPDIQRAHVAAFRSGAIVDLSDEAGDLLEHISGRPSATGAVSEHAYTVRTSGTTGTPKLVQLTRAAFDQYVEQFVDRYALDEGSRLAVWAAPTYDAHHCQLFAALGAGAVGVVAGLDVRRSGRSILDWLRTAGVTHFETTPSILRGLVAAAEDGLPATLAHLMCSGERFEPALARAVAELAGPLGERIRLANEFGPTECVLATWHDVTADDLDLPDLPLGTPIPGRTIEVCPPPGATVASASQPGEIVIRSVNLCAGYGLAGAVESPFPEDENGIRTFRTGDFGYVDDRGRLRLQGRRDRMVKRRGVKIDLDEVERAFRAISYVVDVAALADADPGGTSVLRVWVVSREPGRTEDDVRADVTPHLAAASMPEHVVLGGPLPRLHSGKVDYRELLRRTAARQPSAAVTTAVTTATEVGVVEEFARVLRVPVSTSDANFFALGGHSLLALDLNEGLARRFGVAIDLADVLRHPRAGALAQVIDRRRAQARPAEPADTYRVEPGLTAAERPIWTWTQLFPQDGSANVVAGFRTAVDVPDHEIGSALNQLVRDTPQLRINYVDDDGGRPVRVVRPARPVRVRTVLAAGPVDDCGRPEVRSELYRPFDIGTEQLVRAVVVRSTGSAELAVCVVVHHLVCDGVGLATLVTDLRRRLFDGTETNPAASRASGVAAVSGPARADAGHWRHVADRLRATPRSGELADRPGLTEPGVETFAVSAARAIAASEELPLPAVLVELVAQALLATLDTDAVVIETPVSLRTAEQARAIGNYVVDVPIVVGRATSAQRPERRKAVAADLLDAIEAASAAPGFGAVRPGQGLAPVGDAVVVLEHGAAVDDSGRTTPVRVPGSPPRNPLAFYVVADGNHLDCRVLSRVAPALAEDITTEFRRLTTGSTQVPARQEI